MTTQTAPKARTRKNPLNGTWDVQLQSITRNWHHIGRVRPIKRGTQTDYQIDYEATWRGTYVGGFPSKREAVQAVVDAEAEVGS